MREYVLIEFLLPTQDYPVWSKKLANLGEDYIPISADNEADDGYPFDRYTRISGKISSAYASVIKLQDPYLAQHMRISHIPEDLKNKYRK